MRTIEGRWMVLSCFEGSTACGNGIWLVLSFEFLRNVHTSTRQKCHVSRDQGERSCGIESNAIINKD
jgi:hypothetical protein